MDKKLHGFAWMSLTLVLTVSALSAERSVPTFIFLGASNMGSRRTAAEDLPADLRVAQSDVYSHSLANETVAD